MPAALITILSMIQRYQPILQSVFELISEVQDIMSDDSIDENEKLAKINAIADREDVEFDRLMAEAKAELAQKE